MDGVIAHRLYREHTYQKENVYVKDLSTLGRNIKRCIIIDNHPENFQVHPENGIFIKSWFGDMSDQALSRLAPILRGKELLQEISMTNSDDIRVTLRKVKDAMARNMKNSPAPLRD